MLFIVVLSRVALELVMGFVLAGPLSAAIFAVLSIMAEQCGLAGNIELEVASVCPYTFISLILSSILIAARNSNAVCLNAFSSLL